MSQAPFSKPLRPLLVSQRGAVRFLTLNRPELLNAFDLAAVTDLLDKLVAARGDGTVRAVVITGKGRAFCSGGDLKFALQQSPDEPGEAFLGLTEVLHACIEEICTTPKPVIAAVNGVAAGAGLFLALACDIRLMSESAYLKQANSSNGLSLPAGGSFMLPRLVGAGRALELVLLDRPVSAERAFQLGLVTELAPAKGFSERVYELAARVAALPQPALAESKALVNTSFARPLAEQLEAERQAMARCADSSEGRKALRAFVEKRKPDAIRTGA